MATINYVTKLEKRKNELEELKRKFCMIEPSTDWNQIRIEPLLDYIDKLIRSIQSLPSSIGNNMIEKDLNYFDDNIEGLGEVLNSETEKKKR
jgi:hypothetical protein